VLPGQPEEKGAPWRPFFLLVEAGKAIEKHKAGEFVFASAGIHSYIPTFQVVSELGVHRLRAHRRVGNFH
jgi:hypothetical protein